ncbi:MAG: FAD:protein FMN transferase [Bacteroidetes bacterium]|nr:MAG: FAD:protein FMN transferase [Bacteroidota bacterium]
MKVIKSIIVVLIFFLIISCNSNSQYFSNAGFIHGTIYHITYESNNGVDLKNEIEKCMHNFDTSLSTYDPNSIISRVNNNDTNVVLDYHFKTVFKKAYEVSEKTQGAFDITVAPLVNAWGFGFEKIKNVDSAFIDSILQYVGYQKVELNNNKIIKQNPNIMLDANAIAKGYSVDVVCDFLNEKGVENYLVEIGGEIRAKGVNKNNQFWKIGIDKPIEDTTLSSREIEDVVYLKNQAVATSGNYRQFYIKDGVKYSHTINPKTGFPVTHSLLSASVFCDDCMTADAYATAFMVLGLEKSIAIVKSTPKLEAYFIYSNKKGEFENYYTHNIKKMIIGLNN